MNQTNTGTPLEYVSALAFKLSQFHSLSTLALAKQIEARLNHQAQTVQTDTLPEQLWQNFIITVVEPGWIYLRLTDPGLAKWLQWTIDSPWQTAQSMDQLAQLDQSEGAFKILHAYARCSSLLRLGRDTKLIQFQPDQEFNRLSHPIPWLDAEQIFVAQHPQDWALIRLLSETIDYLAVSAPSKTASNALSAQAARQALKMAHRLSQAFQGFHAACRIWGIADQASVAQVRLGLVLLTRKVLQVLVESRLGWVAHAAL